MKVTIVEKELLARVGGFSSVSSIIRAETAHVE